MKTVLITGIGGNLGKILAKNLHREYNVIGLDRRDIGVLPKDIIHYKYDIRRNRVEDIFKKHKIDTIFHLGVMHNLRENDKEHHEFNIIGTTKLLEYAQSYNVSKFIFLSSANVYGPKATNSQYLNEDEPLMGGANFSDIRDLITLDMLVSSLFWKQPSIQTIILRPVHIVGDLQNGISNYFRISNKVPVLAGFDPMMQLIHISDLIEAFILAMRSNSSGVFNLASSGAEPLSKLIKHLGKKTLPLIDPIFRNIFHYLWRTRFVSFPPEEFDYLKYICMVDTTNAKKELNFNPKYTIFDALDSLNKKSFHNIIPIA
ncbi:NAD-dependent epimerase/dehydratase family protein [bacterium]|nr:NAD-dependent epimerase/dehydratase family protein [bacterium]